MNKVVSREVWLEARRALLASEKEATHLRDKVNRERQALPWVKVDKDYTFDTPSGRKTLSDLFEGRSQLLIYHFMFGPDWDQGCTGCSFLADNLDGAVTHLNNHDVTLAAVSRGPLAKLEAYKKRMGWHFPWVSSEGSDFNFDYHVSFTKDELENNRVFYNFEKLAAEDAFDELHGMSAFYKDENGAIYHTYSSYARGIEEWVSTLMILDRAPKGRNENSTMHFVKRHDEYESQASKHSCCS
ncbi:DUF899 domain-containing protein [Ochrobactrum sp. POC9]|uniref:DUF899 domain-containing protein n=1 Tax=unclassified Ochrobactrum TaxID=239106 RepID=UPI000D7085F6|nr:thioredoxin family protein [Ochrobactrum sp. POC9]MCH4542138.1 thioredoxin family protein [Ochrobactrum sp. A-1]PWU71406.1 DUF899 domain-containing protein [Ochrobactrum sp. POC9]